MLDCARTLAAQSASGTFTGDRAVVNSEFSSVIAKIDRQAQSIGLNLGGEFARSLSVFIGGGNFLGTNTVSAINTAAGNGNAAGAAIFEFYGAGFGDYSTPFTLSVTKGSTIVDGETLVDAINGAIDGLTADSAVKKAFKDAGIQAGLSSDGKTLVFTSASSAFQVQGNNAKAAAFLGAFAGAPVGDINISANRLTANGVVQVGSTPFVWDFMVDGTQAITFSTTDSAGSLHSLGVTLTAGSTGGNINAALTHINSQLQASNDVELKEILAVEEDPSATVRFVSTTKSFTVTLGIDTDPTCGLTKALAVWAQATRARSTIPQLSAAPPLRTSAPR